MTAMLSFLSLNSNMSPEASADVLGINVAWIEFNLNDMSQ